MARQDYFTHFELSQSKGGRNTGDPREKPLDHPQAELGSFRMWPGQGPNPQRWDDERFNYSATGAAAKTMKHGYFMYRVKVKQSVKFHRRLCISGVYASVSLGPRQARLFISMNLIGYFPGKFPGIY